MQKLEKDICLDVGNHLDRLDALTFALQEMIHSATENGIDVVKRDPYLDAATEICGDVRKTTLAAKAKYYNEGEDTQ